MCLKKIFGGNPLPQELPYGGKTALLFAINDYQGSVNNLRGCLNDQLMVEKWLNTYFPEFVIYKFKDRQVTRKIFTEWILKFKNKLTPGDDLFIHISSHGTRGFDKQGIEADGYSEALYLHDGPLWDFELREILTNIPYKSKITLAFDTCFSGGAISKNKYTSFLRKDLYIKPRFTETDIIPPGIRKKSSFVRVFDHSNIIQFAACGEGQTAADAYIAGKYRGAFTYFWIETFVKNRNCDLWLASTKYAINDIAHYSQVPQIWGGIELINKPVFTNIKNRNDD